MSEKTALEFARELLEVTDEWAPAGDIDPGKLAAALAAAEERGRRRGVEERDELRALLREARGWANYTDAASLRDHIDAALAPHDSGSQPARMDAPSGPRCWCGKPSRHESGWCGGLACQGGAPRDSGKEG